MDLNGLELTWLGHAAFRLKTPDGTIAYIDPWLEGNPSCPDSEHHPDRVDAVYLTHGHFDHFGSTMELAALGAQIFCIHEIAVHLEGAGVTSMVGANKGGTVAGPGDIAATMTDAVHSSGISGETGIVAGGEAGGWVLAFPGGPTIYHAGDTSVFGDMTLIGEMSTPDIALLPIGGHFTMGPVGAARAARMLGVATVIPMHYGTFPILAGTPDELRVELDGSGIEVVDLEIAVPVT
ncbi:metal-dependent hydrolase [bacterium]|nr:metal-dependent hydrolase [bacterium]